MPEHMGVDLQTHLAYTAELHHHSDRLGGKTITVRWTGEMYDGEPEFVLVDRPVGCWLRPSICKSFELRTVVNS